jgi:hypothetical protein
VLRAGTAHALLNPFAQTLLWGLVAATSACSSSSAPESAGAATGETLPTTAPTTAISTPPATSGAGSQSAVTAGTVSTGATTAGSAGASIASLGGSTASSAGTTGAGSSSVSAGAPGAAGTDAAGSGNATASSAGAGATAGMQASAGASGAAGMAAPAGPADLDKVGPYEIVQEQVGTGFEYAIASSDTGDGVAGCSSFSMSFGGDPMESMDFIKLPSTLKMNMYSLYRPKELEAGRKYPVLTWGNGTCAHPENYHELLAHLASHGFFVVAANSRQVGSNGVMTKALDWAFAANKDPMSPYFEHIDTDKVGAFGHSQGGGATITAASDARVKVVIIFNGGSSAPKPFLTISGDRDLPLTSLSAMKSAVSSATKGAYLFYHMVPERGSYDGHLTLITQPERVIGPSAAWFKYTLLNDPDAKAWLVGSDCKLCGKTQDIEFGQHGL